MRNDKGFTLIELLVAISIIAVLSTIGLTTYQGIQAKARDSIRRSDLNNLATALALYFQTNGKYVVNSDGSDLISCQNATTGIFYNSIRNNMSEGNVPTDPVSKQAYCYISSNNGQSFRLFAKLENCNGSEGSLCGTGEWNHSVYSDNLTAATFQSSTSFTCPVCVTDIDKNGGVTNLDWSLFNQCYNKSKLQNPGEWNTYNCDRADFNKDQAVTILDYSCWNISPVGTTCPR